MSASKSEPAASTVLNLVVRRLAKKGRRERDGRDRESSDDFPGSPEATQLRPVLKHRNEQGPEHRWLHQATEKLTPFELWLAFLHERSPALDVVLTAHASGNGCFCFRKIAGRGNDRFKCDL